VCGLKGQPPTAQPLLKIQFRCEPILDGSIEAFIEPRVKPGLWKLELIRHKQFVEAQLECDVNESDDADRSAGHRFLNRVPLQVGRSSPPEKVQFIKVEQSSKPIRCQMQNQV